MPTLDIAIIGAGIAGLAAAIALRRSQPDNPHTVTIYEKSRFKNETGAAISITPNGSRVLDAWGFDKVAAKATEKKQHRMWEAETTNLMHQDTFPRGEEILKLYGAEFNAFHRVDLHSQLRKIAEEAGAQIVLAAEVAEVKREGTVILKDGMSVKKDLIVLADGINSPFLECITGMDIKTTKTGVSVYRTLIPMEKLLKDPEVAPLFEGELSGFGQIRNKTQDAGIMTYPCRNDELMNVAIFHTTREDQLRTDAWNSPASVEDALGELKGFHPSWVALVRNANDMKAYTVGHRLPLSKYVNGKAVLVGDAAHPMMPTHAQGGGMSLEDAAALGVMFSKLPSTLGPTTIEDRLKLYQALRLPRDAATQLTSNDMFLRFEPREAENAEIKTFYKGNVKAPVGKSWNKEGRDYFFGYDAFAEAEKALAWAEKNGYHSLEKDGLPEGVVRHFGMAEHDGSVNGV